jgi:hypothetical protein
MESNAMRARVELTCDCVVAKAVAQLREGLAFRHAHAVSILDVTGPSSLGYGVDIVVERVVAPSLSDVLEEQGPTSCGTALDLLAQLIRLEEDMAAFAQSGRCGVHVNPITPEQVLLEGIAGQPGREPRARVRHLFPYDLLVDHTCEASTDRWLPQFDAAYTIPGDPPSDVASGPRARVYGLGLLLYEMLTARRPWEIDSGSVEIPEGLYKRFREPPPSPHERAPEVTVPAAVERVLMSALDPIAANRPAGPSALGEALQNAASAG